MAESPTASATEINYSFILGMYVFFLSVGVVCGVLEFALAVEAVAGFYLIFVPFVPATVWCAVKRRRWLRQKSKSE